MAKNPSDTFFWNDWDADPQLRLCSLAAQGFWMRCLCVAARHDPKGYVAVENRPLTWAELARCAGCTVQEARAYMEDLLRAGVADRDSRGLVFNRRMVRAAKVSEARSEAGRTGAEITNEKKRKSQDLPQQNSGKDDGNISGKDVGKQVASSILLSSNKNHGREDDPEFEEFWKLYPKKVAKPAAFKAFQKARKQAALEAIMAGLRRYAAEPREARFIAHPASWLNNQRWLDEPAAQSAVQAQQSMFDDLDEGEKRWLSRLINHAKGSSWLEDLWGPPPGAPGHMCPAYLTERFRQSQEGKP